MLDCGFAEFLYRALFLSFGANCLPQIEGWRWGGGGLCLAGCGAVAHTQGYLLVCILGSLIKLLGIGVVLKFDVFSHCCQGYLRCLHASMRSVGVEPFLGDQLQ